MPYPVSITRENTPADIGFCLASQMRKPYKIDFSQQQQQSVHHNFPPVCTREFLQSFFPQHVGTSITELRHKAVVENDVAAMILMGDVFFCGFALSENTKHDNADGTTDSSSCSIHSQHYVNVHHDDHECKKGCGHCYSGSIDWYNMAASSDKTDPASIQLIAEAKIQMALIVKMRYMQELNGDDMEPFLSACLPLPAHQGGGHMMRFLEEAASVGYVSIFTIMTAQQFLKQRRKTRLPPHVQRGLQQYQVELSLHQAKLFQQQQLDGDSSKNNDDVDDVVWYKCGNRPACSAKSTTPFVSHNCALCHNKQYCSAICQIEHWREQHRNLCPKRDLLNSMEEEEETKLPAKEDTNETRENQQDDSKLPATTVAAGTLLDKEEDTGTKHDAWMKTLEANLAKVVIDEQDNNNDDEEQKQKSSHKDDDVNDKYVRISLRVEKEKKTDKQQEKENHHNGNNDNDELEQQQTQQEEADTTAAACLASAAKHVCNQEHNAASHEANDEKKQEEKRTLLEQIQHQAKDLIVLEAEAQTLEADIDMKRVASVTQVKADLLQLSEKTHNKDLVLKELAKQVEETAADLNGAEKSEIAEALASALGTLKSAIDTLRRVAGDDANEEKRDDPFLLAQIELVTEDLNMLEAAATKAESRIDKEKARVPVKQVKAELLELCDKTQEKDVRVKELARVAKERAAEKNFIGEETVELASAAVTLEAAVEATLTRATRKLVHVSREQQLMNRLKVTKANEKELEKAATELVTLVVANKKRSEQDVSRCDVIADKLDEVRSERKELEVKLKELWEQEEEMGFPKSNRLIITRTRPPPPPRYPIFDVQELTNKSRDLVLKRYKIVAHVALNSTYFNEGTEVPQLINIFQVLMLSKNYTDAVECLAFAAKKLLIERKYSEEQQRLILGKILEERIKVYIQVARVSPSEYVIDHILSDCVLLHIGVIRKNSDDMKAATRRELLAIEQEANEIKKKLDADECDEVVATTPSPRQQQGSRRKRSNKGGKKKSKQKPKPTPKREPVKPLVHLSGYLVISGAAKNAASAEDYCPICHVQWRHMDTDNACFAVVFRQCQHAVCAKCLCSLHKSCQETFENETAEEEQQVKFVCTLCRERLPKNLPWDAAKEIVARNLVDSFPQFVEVFPSQFDTKNILASQMIEHDFQVSEVENAMFATMQLLGSDDGEKKKKKVSCEEKNEIYEQARFPVEPLYWTVKEAEKRVDKIWNTSSREYQEALIELNRARKDLKKAKINAMKDVYERMNSATIAAAETTLTRACSSSSGAAEHKSNDELSDDEDDDDEVVFVDLHGLLPYEAPRILAEFVLPALPVLKRVVVITGRGVHCESGESDLKAKVQEYLLSKTAEVLAVEQVEGNPGRLLVTATSI